MELKKTEKIIFENEFETLTYNEKNGIHTLYYPNIDKKIEYDYAPIDYIFDNVPKENLELEYLKEILKNEIRKEWKNEIDDIIDDFLDDEIYNYDFGKIEKMLKNIDFIDKNYGFISAVAKKILTDLMEK